MADNLKSKPDEDNYVSCTVCLKEVPSSAARHDEASDYVYYFCGSDCYAKWRLKEGEEL